MWIGREFALVVARDRGLGCKAAGFVVGAIVVEEQCGVNGHVVHRAVGAVVGGNAAAIVVVDVVAVTIAVESF